MVGLAQGWLKLKLNEVTRYQEFCYKFLEEYTSRNKIRKKIVQ